AGQRRRDKLVSAELRSPNGPLLCRPARALLHVLPDVDGPARDGGVGWQRAGWRWIARHLHRRDRLPDWKARLEVSLRGNGGRIWRWHRFTHDGGRPAVR